VNIELEVDVKFVPEDFPDLSLFHGRDPTEQSNTLNKLVVAWVCAKEKAKNGKSVKKPAQVALHWWEKGGPIVTPQTPIELKRVTIETSERDEIVPYLNGINICRLMPILHRSDSQLPSLDSLFFDQNEPLFH
jgi:hypothetical protein